MASGQTLEAPAQIPKARLCPYCGDFAPQTFPHCPHCRQTLPEMLIREDARAEKRGQIRRGLLYMLLAAVIHYLAGGYGPMVIPFPVNPLVTVYLTPLLFLSGLGLTLYGFYLLIQTQ